MNSSAAGDNVRPRAQPMEMWRGGIGGSSCRTTVRGSSSSTDSSGTTAMPMPARTMAAMAALSLVRNT
jgi:hypothetical protein